jgi:hypothetical protein
VAEAQTELAVAMANGWFLHGLRRIDHRGHGVDYKKRGNDCLLTKQFPEVTPVYPAILSKTFPA